MIKVDKIDEILAARDDFEKLLNNISKKNQISDENKEKLLKYPNIDKEDFSLLLVNIDLNNMNKEGRDFVKRWYEIYKVGCGN